MGYDPIANGWRKFIKNETNKVPGDVLFSVERTSDGPNNGKEQAGMVPGESYFICFDNEVYEVVATGNGSACYLNVAGGMFMQTSSGWAITPPLQGYSTITISTVKTETVHTIDPKYLPSGIGGGLPTVELETVPTLDGAELSASDIAKLEAVGYALPCVLKCTFDDENTMTFVAQGTSVDMGGQIGYLATGNFRTGVMGNYGVLITNMVSGKFTAYDIGGDL